ncbi:MAG: hypothetical protein WKF74_06970 [Pyrinomonadaceae bacterium]
MLDLIGEVFDQVPFKVTMSIIFTLSDAILFRWNHCLNAVGCDCFEQLMGIVSSIVASISNEHTRREVFDQCGSLRAVVALATRQHKAQGIAQSINGGVNLSWEATATST